MFSAKVKTSSFCFGYKANALLISTVIVSLIDSLFFHTSDSKGFFLSTPVHFRIVSIVARCLMQTNDSFDICKNQSKQLIRCSHLVCQVDLNDNQIPARVVFDSG